MLGALLLSMLALSPSPQDGIVLPPAPPVVHARLALKTAQSTFKQGERIPIVMTLSADTPGYFADQSDTYPAFGQMNVRPEAGRFRWLNRFAKAIGGDPIDTMSTLELTRSGLSIEGAVNQWVRFDAPGEYTIQMTGYVYRGTGFADMLTVLTNSVTFRIAPMADADEAAQAHRLVARIADRTLDQINVVHACEDLTFLGGKAATDILVGQLASANSLGASQPEFTADLCRERLRYGWFMSRFPERILFGAEQLLADVSKPPDRSWLTTAIEMRHWLETPDGPPVESAMLLWSGPIARRYLDGLAETLDRRVGSSKAVAAELLINTDEGPVLPAAARAVVDGFEELSPEDQHWLLSERWDAIHDARLLPALRRQLALDGDSSNDLLPAMIDAAPELARPRVIAMVQAGEARGRDEIVSRLPDAEVPELDQALLAQFAALVKEVSTLPRSYGAVDSTRLLARFATSRILSDVRRGYDQSKALLFPETRGYVLAYLLKHDATEGERLIREAIIETSGPDDLIDALATVAYSPTVEGIVVERLNSADPHVVLRAVGVLRLHGAATARTSISKRFERWLTDWNAQRERPFADADAVRAEEELQCELIAGLVRAEHWTAPKDEVDRLLATCVTDRCRQIVGGR